MSKVAVANNGSSSVSPLFSISGIQRRRPTCVKLPSLRYQPICSRICSISSKALKIQLVVVRNAAGCIACAWLTSVCYSIGNIFSGKLSYLQSRDELIVANSVWSAIAFCTVVYTSYTPLMLSLRFLNAPDHPPTLWYCLTKLARATIVYFVATIVATLAFGFLVAYLAQVEPTTFNYKFECYADIFSLIFYYTGIAREMKRIYYEETCQGRDKLLSRKKRACNSSRSITPQAEALSVPVRYRAPVFWKAYVKQLPSFVPPMLATVAVHVLSRQRLVNQGSLTFNFFFLGATAFKLTIQELSKLYVVKKRIQSTRIMCVLVGVPTVLIDTQTRIILSGSSNMRTTVKGVLGMALVEIGFRLVKARVLQWTITKRQNVIFRQKKDNSSTAPSMPVEFEMWKRQVQAFHTVELNADMYAEYIAIGCSGSILFFFGTHPRYPLLRQSYSVEEIVDLSTWRLNQLYILGFQFGVEVVVDYISIVLEMAAGLEFDEIKNLGSFLAVLFMVTAVTNLTISIGVYLS